MTDIDAVAAAICNTHWMDNTAWTHCDQDYWRGIAQAGLDAARLTEEHQGMSVFSDGNFVERLPYVRLVGPWVPVKQGDADA